MGKKRKTNAEPREGYISIEEFIRIAGVKEVTIKRNRDKIPGLSYENGEYLIIEGTRYPFNIGRNKMKDSNDRRYLLLKAISENKYIDHNTLGIYNQQFEQFLRDLLDANLIRNNGMQNHYGANSYDCTEIGDRILLNKKTAKTEIAKAIAEVAGTFVGTALGSAANAMT